MQPFNLQLLGGLGVLARSCPVAAATATGPCQCHLPMIPAITGMASVLQQSKFILIMHAFSIKIYKMDSDLSTAITKVKVFWPFKVKKDSILFYFAGSFCKLQFWFECHIHFDYRSLFYFHISLPNGTHLLSLIAGNSNLKQACLSPTVLTAD